MGDLCLHLFIYIIWTHRYLCYILGSNLILLNFVVHIIPVLAIGRSFSLLLDPFDTLPLVRVFFCLLFLSTSLLSGITRCFKLIMYVSCPSSRISCFSKGLTLFFNDTYPYLTLYYIFVCIYFLFLSPPTKLQVPQGQGLCFIQCCVPRHRTAPT